MRYVSAGPHTLSTSELKDLVRAGYIGKGSAPGDAIAQAYLSTHLDMSASPTGAPKTVREGALTYLERMLALYSDKAATELGADVVSTLETHFLPFINRTEGQHVFEALKDPKNHGKYLGNILTGKVDNWSRRYKMIVATELNRAQNWGAADAILHNNKGKTPHDIFVYKTGTHDYADSCDVCQRFWFTPAGAPKIYKLSELLANGSNIGKKKAEWKPTVDNTHPHCVHVLHELKPGYGFDASGGLTYVGADHSEYAAQKTGT
jgi:hypothetical protein